MNNNQKITELDFFKAKEQLKEFLKNETSGKFKDLDFEGSNFSVFLDVLAYNTYQNNFYANMAISEMFLDSAQLENSIVSHAKELNYLPRSAVSSKAVLLIKIVDPNDGSSNISIPKNTKFTTSSNGSKYNFYTAETYLARRKPGTNTFISEEVEVFEGEQVEEVFTIENNDKNIKLLNSGIDTSSIAVKVVYPNGLEKTFLKTENIFGVEPNDSVFYIEPGFDSTYEIAFGNGVFGEIPPTNSKVFVSYRITNGEEANGACNFTSSFKNSLTTIDTIQKAFGGSEKESLEDIKFFAPKSIQIQERAVTKSDYEILLKQKFNEIEDISVINGSDLKPPQYGKAGIFINAKNGLSETKKQKYEDFLKDKTVFVRPIFLDPQFIYGELDINVLYSPKKIDISKSEIENKIRTILRTYAEQHLNRFGAILELSRISALIDNSNAAILNNTIVASPYILYSPEFNKKENPEFDFNTKFSQPESKTLSGSVITSSVFQYNNINATLEDDGKGNIDILNNKEKELDKIKKLKNNTGIIDYAKGLVKLSDFITNSYPTPGIKLKAKTEELNISSPETRILILKDEDIHINIREDT